MYVSNVIGIKVATEIHVSRTYLYYIMYKIIIACLADSEINLVKRLKLCIRDFKEREEVILFQQHVCYKKMQKENENTF